MHFNYVWSSPIEPEEASFEEVTKSPWKFLVLMLKSSWLGQLGERDGGAGDMSQAILKLHRKGPSLFPSRASLICNSQCPILLPGCSLVGTLHDTEKPPWIMHTQTSRHPAKCYINARTRKSDFEYMKISNWEWVHITLSPLKPQAAFSSNKNELVPSPFISDHFFHI